MSISFGLGQKSKKAPQPKPVPKQRSALAPDSDQEDETEQKPKTLDEEALDALLGKSDKKATISSIKSAANERFKARATDDNAFKSDADARPEDPTITDYDEVPIEGFGAALLNGMGWNNGEGRFKGVTAKVRNKIRPTGLGIGASAPPNGIEVGNKGDKRNRKPDRSVDFAKRKNPLTGELVTEEEYQKLRQNQELVTGESRSRPRSRDRGESDVRVDREEYSSKKRSNGSNRHRSRSPDGHRRRHRDERSDSFKSSRHEHERSSDRHRSSWRDDRSRHNREYRDSRRYRD